MPHEMASEFRTALEHASSVLIGTHLNPDGDALGSSLALSLHLDRLGIENEVVCHHAPPSNLEFLPGINRVRQEPKHDKHDLGVILDLDSVERLGNTEPFFAPLPHLIVIDHHVPHQAPGDLRIVDTSAPATAVILTRLLLELGAVIDSDMATCLLTGIVTDTGSFRFRNTTPEALHLAAKLIECGGDINLISEEVFHRKPLASARLLGRLLEHMQMDSRGRLCWAVLTSDDYEQTDAKDEDTEGFVNELLSINTVQIAALIREPRPGRVRVSLRSRGNFDVAAVAQTVGGGGHRNAAGCSFQATPAEAADILLPKLRECLASSS